MADKEKKEPKEREELDLFKVVIVLSGLAVLVFAVMIFLESRRLSRIKKAFNLALADIPKIKRSYETIMKLKESREKFRLTVGNPNDYVEKYIREGGGLEKTDFTFSEKKETNAKQGFEDRLIYVNFGKGKNRKYILRQNILYMLYNIEAVRPQCKIGRLSMVAKELVERDRKKSDPKVLSDYWYIRELAVVRRIPLKVRKRSGKRNKRVR